MAVSAIGGVIGTSSQANQTSGISVNDFVQLFLNQLTFQDPLHPVDNSQILAQLAQFTNLEQTQEVNQNVAGLLQAQATSQTIALLGQTVEVSQNGTTTTGTVTTVTFTSGVPSITIKQSNGTDLPNVDPSQITLVRQAGAS